MRSQRVDALASIEASVDRPYSGADHRHAGTEDCKHNCNHRIPQRSKPHPSLEHRNGTSDHGSKEANQEERSHDRGDEMEDACREAGAEKVGASAIEENSAGQKTLQE